MDRRWLEFKAYVRVARSGQSKAWTIGPRQEREKCGATAGIFAETGGSLRRCAEKSAPGKKRLDGVHEVAGGLRFRNVAVRAGLAYLRFKVRGFVHGENQDAG